MSETPHDAYIEMTVPPALDGERLDRAVSMLGGCSRSQASAIIEASGASLNGQPVTKPSHRLRDGDVLQVPDGPAPEPDHLMAEPEVEFAVAWEDDHLVVVDKPAGLVVHPGAGNPTGTLANGLLHRYPQIASLGDPLRPGIVHRLDSGTSGLMVVAKDAEAFDGLVDQLAARLVHRVYSALVDGHLAHRRGVVDAAIGRSRRDPLKMAVAADGREARTHYEVDREFSRPIETSLLTCRLETGRTHQIRVHMASIGHPVIGDVRYGGRRGRLALDRPFLHARELGFVHPVSGEAITVTSEMPDDLVQVLAQLDAEPPG